MGLPGLWYNIGNQERLFNNTTSTSGSRSFCSADFLPLLASLRDLEIILFFSDQIDTLYIV